MHLVTKPTATLAALSALLALGLPAPVRADEPPPPPAPLLDPAELADPSEAPAPPPPAPAPSTRVVVPALEAAPVEATAPSAPSAPLPRADPSPADGVFSTLGWGTVAGGAVAAAAVGGLALLSPCACAAPVACGATTCALGGGALVGHTMEGRPWSAKALLPAGAAAGVGLAAGSAATLAVIVTPPIMDAMLPDAGADPDAARGNMLAATGVTVGVAALALVGGGLVAGWAATAVERALDEEPAPAPVELRAAGAPRATEGY